LKNRLKKNVANAIPSSDDTDMIFSLDEDHLENNVSDNATRTCIGNSAILSNVPVQKPRSRSPLRSKIFTTSRRKHVSIFPLSIFTYSIISIIFCFLF